MDNLNLVNAIKDYYQLVELYTYNDRQTRIEFRALFYGPALTEYWYWIAHPEMEKYAVEFFNNRDSIAFKSFTQSAAWSVAITQRSVNQYEKLIEANQKVLTLIDTEIN